MPNLRRHVVIILSSLVIVLSVALFSSWQLEEEHPLSLPNLKTKLLPPSPKPPLEAFDQPSRSYPPPPPPAPPPLLTPPPFDDTPAVVPVTLELTPDVLRQTYDRLVTAFPGGPGGGGATISHEALNRRNFRRFKTCLARRAGIDLVEDDPDVQVREGEEDGNGEITCPDEVFKVALLFTDYYASWPSTRGEDIQCSSVIESLIDLGYTYFIHGGNWDPDEIVRYYDTFRDMTSFILLEDDTLQMCLASSSCIRSPSFPTGPPLSLVLTSSWWGYRPDRMDGHPLGNEWVLTPEKIPGHTYLGYSIERECMKVPFIEHKERDDVAPILAKEMKYFYGGQKSLDHSAYPLPLYSLLPNLTSLNPLLLAPASPQHATPPSLDPLGHLSPSDYTSLLSHSKALIGIGFPGVSPSPYYALCLGVPFINPIRADSTLSREEWYMDNQIFWWQGVQHGPLGLVGEPWVYNIRSTVTEDGDGDGELEENELVGALRKARERPIGRFVPEEMREEVMRERVRGLMERDWAGEGRKREGKMGVVGAGEEEELVKGWVEGMRRQKGGS